MRRCYAYAEFGEIRSGAPPCGPFGRASRGFPPSFALRCIPTPAPWTVQWHLKALKSVRGLRRNRISPRSFPRDTCDNLRPNRPWRSPRVKNQAIELANSSHWRGRCSHVDSVEKSAYAKHLRTNKDPPLPRSDPHLCPKSPKNPSLCTLLLCLLNIMPNAHNHNTHQSSPSNPKRRTSKGKLNRRFAALNAVPDSDRKDRPYSVAASRAGGDEGEAARSKYVRSWTSEE